MYQLNSQVSSYQPHIKSLVKAAAQSKDVARMKLLLVQVTIALLTHFANNKY